MKKITISALAFILIICAILGFSTVMSSTISVNETNASYEIALENDEIKDVYNLNGIVEFPTSVEISYNENNYTATNGVIIYPSGSAYGLSKHTLSELGNYSVKYFFTVEGERIAAVKSFTVNAPYYSLAKDDGSNMEFPNDEPVTFNGKDGFRVNLKDGNEFVFNEPIDLNDTNGNLASIINITPVMGDHSIETVYKEDGSPTWINYYSANAKYVIVRLTDCYDSNKYVEILYHYANYQGYLRTRTNNQADVGIGALGTPHSTINRPANQKNVYQDGLLSAIWVGEYGMFTFSVFTSKSSTGSEILYDNATNRVYSQCVGKRNLVTDLMNEEIYGTDVFEGFTTGEVYLSMRAEEFVQDSLSIDIHSIGKYSATELIAMQDKVYADTKQPEINIDVEKTDNNGVYVAIGDTVRIPSAYALDVNALGDISVKVYRKYNTQEKIKVPVIDGCFKVDSSDVYTIEYSQKDKYGNVGVATLDVCPKYTEGDKKSVWLDFDTPIEQVELFAGVESTLPSFTVGSLNKVDDVKVKILVKKGDDVVEIDANKRTFIPETSGEYTLTVILEDNFGYKQVDYKLNCGIDENSVQFKEVPTLPKYFLKGQTYNLGEIYAYEYSTGKPVKVVAETYAILDGGAETKIEDTTKLEITASNTVKLIYRYNGKSYNDNAEVKVRDVSYTDGSVSGIDVFKYFVSEDTTYEDMAENKKGQMERVTNATFIANEDLTKARIEFVNAISIENFTLKYEIPKLAGEYNTVRFILTGMLDSSEQAVIEVKKDYITKSGTDELVEVCNVYVDGKFAFTLSRNFAEDRVKTVSYNNLNAKLTIESSSVLKQIQITGSMCYLTIEMDGITGKAGIEISQINNQLLNGKTFKDTSAPEISCNNSQGEYKLGDTVKLNVPVISDVLSQIDYSSIRLTVSTHSGATVTATDGTVLSNGTVEALKEYELVLDRRETYYVNYSVKDYAGKSASYNYMMYVVDMEAPVIEFTDDIAEGDEITIDKGDKISVEFNVSDKVSAPEKIATYVHLYKDDNSIYVLNVGNEFRINESGKYTVKVVARDEAGNMSIASFKVIVE